MQIKVILDPEALEAVPGTCAVGSAWAGYLFDCTMLDSRAPEEILLVGAQASSTARGSALAVASFTVRARANITSHTVSGITAYIDSLSFGETKITSTEAVAANGSVAILTSRRRLLEWEAGSKVAVFETQLVSAQPLYCKGYCSWRVFA